MDFTEELPENNRKQGKGKDKAEIRRFKIIIIKHQSCYWDRWRNILFYPDSAHAVGGKEKLRSENTRELGCVKERVKAGVTLSEVLCDAVQCFSPQSLPPPPSLCRSGEEAGSAELLNPEWSFPHFQWPPLSEAGSEQGWGCPDISGTAASQEEKKTSVLQFAFVKVWRKGKGKRPFFFFFPASHSCVFLQPGKYISAGAFLSGNKGAKRDWGSKEWEGGLRSFKERDLEQPEVPFS